jgi:hypothetical protein
MNAKPQKAEARFRRDEARLDDAGRTGAVPVAPTGVRFTTPFLRRTLELLKLQRPPLPSAPARSTKPETQPRPLATLADACPALANLKLA